MKTRIFWSLALSTLVIVGCGESGPKLAPVTGTVTLNGEPVEGATVTFLGDNAALVAGGKTDAQGKFTLKTGDREGAILGRHTIAVSKLEGGDNLQTDQEAALNMATTGAVDTSQYQPKHLLPQKYASPGTSELTETVKDGPNDFTIELTGS